jgi:hypothetical protein
MMSSKEAIPRTRACEHRPAQFRERRAARAQCGNISIHQLQLHRRRTAITAFEDHRRMSMFGTIWQHVAIAEWTKPLKWDFRRILNSRNKTNFLMPLTALPNFQSPPKCSQITQLMRTHELSHSSDSTCPTFPVMLNIDWEIAMLTSQQINQAIPFRKGNTQDTLPMSRMTAFEENSRARRICLRAKSASRALSIANMAFRMHFLVFYSSATMAAFECHTAKF